jgi:hypothetical protein
MNAWLKHVMDIKKANPDKAFKDVLKLAKKSYKTGVSTVKYAVTGKKSRKVKKGKTAKKGKKSKSSKKSKKGKKSRGRK